MAETFGQALRRLREEAGVSQSRLARLVPISQASLSRYEADRQVVDPTTARRLDELLNAGGVLRALAPSVPAPDELERVEYAKAHPTRVDRAAISALDGVLAATRRLEDITSAATVLPMVRAQLDTVTRLIANAPSAVRPVAAGLGSQCEQFFGWLLLATDQNGRAVAHFDVAIGLGAEAGDPTFFAQALSFKAYAALLDDRPGTAASLSAVSRRDAHVYLPLRAYDAYQQALALATEADEKGAERVLGEAHDLAQEAAEDRSEAPNGAYWYSPAFLKAQHGLVLLRLGRYDQSANLLALGLDEWPDDLRNSEWGASYQQELDAARAAS